MSMKHRAVALGAAAILSGCGQLNGGAPSTAVSEFYGPTFQILAVGDFSAAESAILQAANEERARHGLGPLEPWAELTRVSREHCQDMVDRQYFNHTTPDGKGPVQRLRDAGIEFSVGGETSHYPDIRPRSVIDDWLAHPGGKSQLLDSRFTVGGPGIVYSTTQQRYYVNLMYIQP